jgi:hypothetical protein
MHLSEKNLLKILDMLVERPTWAVAMRSIGASERQAYEWRAKSIAAAKANDTSSPFYIQWRGAGDFWHNHAGRARSEQLISYEAQIRDQAQHGVEEVVLGPMQTPIYRENPRYLHRDDDFIRLSEGLDAGAPVTWFRYEHDASGHPIPLTKITQLPAPLRRAVLAQIPSYKENTLDVSVEHSGIVQISPAMERLASEPRPGLAELRALAALSPEARRAKLGAKPAPVNARGLVIAADLGTPRGDNRSDHIKEQQPIAPPPNPRMYEVPKLNPPRPSYAKPLDQSGRGRGEPPPGGMKMC